MTKKMTDAVVLDIVAEILRTPEWGSWTIEDVAEIVGRVRDVESLNSHDEDGEPRDPEEGTLVPGRDRYSH